MADSFQRPASPQRPNTPESSGHAVDGSRYVRQRTLSVIDFFESEILADRRIRVPRRLQDLFERGEVLLRVEHLELNGVHAFETVGPFAVDLGEDHELSEGLECEEVVRSLVAALGRLYPNLKNADGYLADYAVYVRLAYLEVNEAIHVLGLDREPRRTDQHVFLYICTSGPADQIVGVYYK